jgi:hypothetical protein
MSASNGITRTAPSPVIFAFDHRSGFRKQRPARSGLAGYPECRNGSGARQDALVVAGYLEKRSAPPAARQSHGRQARLAVASAFSPERGSTVAEVSRGLDAPGKCLAG